MFKAVTLLAVLISVNTFAKTPVNTTLWQKVEDLQYPKLPIEITERIQGKKATPSIFPVGFGLNIEWPLVNVGFQQAVAKTPSQSLCTNQIVVAVIDTGVDYTHPALKENIWVNAGETGLDSQGRDKATNGIDDDGNGFVDDVVGWDFVHDVPLPMDNHGHGTHIAGIIGAKPSVQNGLSGICPGVAIMALKYYDNSGLGLNNLQNTVKAIQYAVKMGANIINYSGGGAEPAVSEKAAIELARKNGILFVAAAGNDGHNNDLFPYYPASYGLDNIISVASLNKQNQLLPSSNYGKTVQVAAPGLSIPSTLPQARMGTMSGTSQATAFVTGAAAMLAYQMKENELVPIDYKRIKRWIELSAKALPKTQARKPVRNGLLSIPDSLALMKNSIHRPNKNKKFAPSIALKPVSQ